MLGLALQCLLKKKKKKINNIYIDIYIYIYIYIERERERERDEFLTQLNLRDIIDNIYDQSNHKIAEINNETVIFYVENLHSNCRDKKNHGN